MDLEAIMMKAGFLADLKTSSNMVAALEADTNFKEGLVIVAIASTTQALPSISLSMASQKTALSTQMAAIRAGYQS